MIQIIMPQAGQTMEEGTIVRWRKNEGDTVVKGEILLEIETDKSTIEVEAADGGTLRKILVPAGATVPVLQPIALLGDPSEPITDAAAQPAAPAPAQAAKPAAAAGPVGDVKPILMPKAGQSVEEATIVKWRVAPGARIKKGEVIFEVETDKSVVEVEATDDGRLARIVVGEGATVAVLQPVAWLAENDADVDAFLSAECGVRSAGEVGSRKSEVGSQKTEVGSQNKTHNSQPTTHNHSLPTSPLPLPTSAGGRVKASPAARRAASEAGIAVAAAAPGSGPGGRILFADVARAVAAAPAPKAAPKSAAIKPAPAVVLGTEPVRRPMSRMRKAIATNLSFSKQNIPHWYVQRIVDAGPMMAFYRAEKAKYPCSVNDVITLACARTIAEFPAMRSKVDGGDIIEFPWVNIGIAVAVEEGLVVPVVQGTEKMDLAQIAAETRRIAELARGGKLEGVGKGNFTISNLGMFGVDQFCAIINPPEAAILAVGAVKEDVIVKDGAMKPGRTVSLTLSMDHRIIDGALAAKFMARLRELLENPEMML